MVERFTVTLSLLGFENALNRYGTGGNCTFFRCCRPDFPGRGCSETVLTCRKIFRAVVMGFFVFLLGFCGGAGKMWVLECGVFVVILWWMVYRRWFLETTLRGAGNFPLF
jgi:hypothetical protein